MRPLRARGISARGNLSFTCQICIVDSILNDSALIWENPSRGLFFSLTDILISIEDFFRERCPGTGVVHAATDINKA